MASREASVLARVVVVSGALVKLLFVRLPTNDPRLASGVELIAAIDAVVFSIVVLCGRQGSGPSSLNALGSWILYKKRKPKANSDEPIRSASAVRIGIELLSGLNPHFHSR